MQSQRQRLLLNSISIPLETSPTHQPPKRTIYPPPTKPPHHPSKLTSKMTALFNFQSLLLCILLAICTCAYTHSVFPAIMDRNKDGALGIFWKLARIGERLSPYVSICCIFMAGSMLVGQ
ncbi:DUF1242-domain-containing protein [Microthyrium microscopicum]|uniref:DUF1242-domain-containing protein n=1 Tax=Microthyrium microscopicum TaxID=703497 RepID=A0A6A6U270_9PEZI|nr:DUF1242-domain-containing protein [Microthyrium microscopicum]